MDGVGPTDWIFNLERRFSMNSLKEKDKVKILKGKWEGQVGTISKINQDNNIASVSFRSDIVRKGKTRKSLHGVFIHLDNLEKEVA